mgnify:CR=1 FL=1
MEEVLKIELIMKQVGTGTAERACVQPALSKAEKTGAPAASIELPDGRVVTGKTSDLLGASAAAILNALDMINDFDYVAVDREGKQCYQNSHLYHRKRASKRKEGGERK